jgi:hypothetical protein
MYTLSVLTQRLFGAAAVLFLVGTLLCTPARAREARLTDIVVTNTQENLLTYLRVTDCFTPDMNTAIENGIHTTFTFFIRLYEVRRFWWDKKLVDIEVSHGIQYDSLKKVYLVTRSERDNQVVSVKDFGEAKELMSNVEGLKVIELRRLIKGTPYRVSMMAELDKVRLPFYLHYVFFFLSLWDFNTNWYTVNFVY